MRQKMLDVTDDVGKRKMPVSDAARQEAQAFLRWATDDHFTFLGYREYRIRKQGSDEVLAADDGTGLGLLRARETNQPRKLSTLAAHYMPHSGAADALILTKTNARATVHRPGYMDYIGVLSFDANGRAVAERDATVEWVDCNLGSKLTMKYPSVYLTGERAHGEILSIAFAGEGQHQDAGGKIVHAAPNTTSNIFAKSISKNGGRSSYRGLLEVAKGAHGAKSKVVCDALLLDEDSRSDTYPTIRIGEDDVDVGHEATVSKVGSEQLFYLMSHGLTEEEAGKLIVNGFIEPIVKELPMEYAIEMNRLIELQMEGSIG